MMVVLLGCLLFGLTAGATAAAVSGWNITVCLLSGAAGGLVMGLLITSHAVTIQETLAWSFVGGLIGPLIAEGY